jgi:hypothetical protein
MPGTSELGGKKESAEWVIEKGIKTVLDVGPGMGNYADLFKNNGISLELIDGVEIWEPYVERFGLTNKYDNLFVEDIRKWNSFNYDLVIFGDILEHMTKEEAIAVWDKASGAAKYAIISIPTIHYPQGEAEGNPYEEHVKDDWSVQEVLDTFPGIVSHLESGSIGVFFAIFKQD